MAAETEGNWRVSVLRLNCQYVTKLPISDTPHLAPNGARRCELFGSHTQTVNHTIMQLSSTFSSNIWSKCRQSGGHLRSNDLRGLSKWGTWLSAIDNWHHIARSACRTWGTHLVADLGSQFAKRSGGLGKPGQVLV